MLQLMTAFKPLSLRLRNLSRSLIRILPSQLKATTRTSPRAADLTAPRAAAGLEAASARRPTNTRMGRGPRDDAPHQRERNNEWQERKRRKVNRSGENGDESPAVEPSYMSIQFPKTEIAAEERRPKRKVAVMIGYAGTGYHGLQINHKEKTIEGDIFAAFVAAKAISKANADDPRKSSFVRCARTDKGVHAAGNMLSLKLIIEDPDIVKKINDKLPPQIRVWDIQRTVNSFSCYQACDSRWYEYLIPSYCLLPPHPESFLGKKVLASIKEKNVEEEYAKRLGEVKDYWGQVEKNDIQPILNNLDPDTQETVLRRLHTEEKDPNEPNVIRGETLSSMIERKSGASSESPKGIPVEDSTIAAELASAPATSTEAETQATDLSEEVKPKEIHPVDRALREIKAAYVAAKRRYRVAPERLSQLQQALDHYLGTKNFHNYTVRKSHSEPSAKRTIRSFKVNPEPVQINDTQWLSLRVHGQSFMMHQIRKMVGMAVLVARCGTPMSIIDESYGAVRISIPKAPSLGLLLERPVFENYNKRARESLKVEELDFGNYEKEIRAFKDAFIYRRMFETEEKENSFHTFFHQVDNYKSDYFLWLTAAGIEAAETRRGPLEGIPEALKEELGDEAEDGEEDPEGGEG
ncbi:pseudouridine synthase [Xylariaceae sp. FL0662B]|nr:pseudouridine synthase [Xylariaceae sp. FL0662B]